MKSARDEVDFELRSEQAAAVYHGEVELMAPIKAESDAINNALRLIGVPQSAPLDEFDTLWSRRTPRLASHNLLGFGVSEA